jgi:hypothetical protein
VVQLVGSVIQLPANAFAKTPGLEVHAVTDMESREPLVTTDLLFLMFLLLQKVYYVLYVPTKEQSAVVQVEEHATEEQEHVNARTAGQVAHVLDTMEELEPPVIEFLVLLAHRL